MLRSPFSNIRRFQKTLQGALSLFFAIGFTYAEAGLAVAQSAPININYTLGTTSRVSLNIYNQASGQIVRELLHGARRMAGANTEPWDGRDDAGNAVPVGTYNWKLLSTPGFSAEYLMSPGSNYAVNNTDPFWAQSPGCHGGAASVAVDSTGVYIAGGYTENVETRVLKQSVDGTRRLWSTLYPAPWRVCVAMASVGDTLWLYDLTSGPPTDAKVHRYNKATGEIDPLVLDVYTLAPGVAEQPTDMAVDGTSIILSYPVNGVVRWLDYSGVETRRINVAGAKSVDVAPNGTVYTISGNDLSRILPGATAPTVFVPGLTAPRRAAVNPVTGDISVVLNGTSNQVNRYASSGILLKTYGKPGGRTDGLYQPQKNSFRGATDIAVNDSGDFWVTENEAAPRRTVRFDINGTWVAEWYGGQVWAPWIVAEPDNPRYAWMASYWGDIMRLDLNYATKTWTVLSCYRTVGMADGMYPQLSSGDVMQARVHAGTLYLCLNGNPNILKVDRVNSVVTKVQPVVVGLFGYNYQWQTLPWLQAAGAGYSSVLWTDANGDGRVLGADGKPQTGELSFKTASYPGWSAPSADSDLNYLFQVDRPGTGPDKIAKYSVSAWNAVGAPLYNDFPDGTDIADQPPRMSPPYDSRYSAHLINDSNGNIWGAFNPNVTGWNVTGDAFVARYNPDGALAWMAGHKGTRPGTLNSLRTVYGVVNNGPHQNNVVVGGWSVEWPTEGVTPVYVYDQDGLYAGQILGLPLNTAVASWKYGLGAEALAGAVNKDTEGNVYFFGDWINEARVYRITGWAGWQRASGSIKVPMNYAAPPSIAEAVGPDGAGTGLRGIYYTSTDWTGTPVLTRVDASLNYTWNAHGSTAGSPTDTTEFSVRWSGTLVPRRTGWHMFQQIWGGAASRFRVNNIDWIDRNGPGRAIWLSAGKPYPITLDYTSAGTHPANPHAVSLQWSEPECNGLFTLVPTSQLFPAQ